MTIQGVHIHFDGACGAAGDMTLGAFIDLGVPESVVREAMKSMGVDPERLQVARVIKKGIAAVDVKVRTESPGHAHHAYADIRRTLDAADISEGAKTRARDIFARIARAEAKLHGTTVDDVVFHEVGAIDSITDVVGAAAGLDWLRPSSVSADAMFTGRGTVGSAHGRLPVPSPAALQIMSEAGAPIQAGNVERELLTPTGAAILAHAVTDWRGAPEYVPVNVGYGAGDMDLDDRANVLRVTAGLAAENCESMTEVEANIDDMSGELCAHVAGMLMAAGAADVWWTPIYMKKARPAVKLSVLCSSSAVERLTELIFREATTIGVRYRAANRLTAEREVVSVDTEYGNIPVKVARFGGRVVNVGPEFDSCEQAAREHGVAVKEVFAAAVSAYRREKPNDVSH